MSLQLRSRWRNPSTRRLEAVRACHERDISTLLSLLDSYIDLRSRKGVNTSADTREYYHIATSDWLHYCWSDPEASPDVPILRASEDDVAHYLATLLQQGGHLEGSSGKPLSPGSVAAYLAGIRAFYRALIWAGALTHSPAQSVPTPQDPRPQVERRPALPNRDYQALLEHIEHHYDGARQARTRLLVRLLGDEGLRISEAANLHVEDIDMRNRQLYVRRGKGGKTRTLPLSQACYHALREWLNMRPAHARADEATLLVNVGKKVKKTRRGKAMHVNTIRLELDRLYKQLGFGQRYRGAHMLRHTAGTRLYQQTRDLHVVSQILGHSDVNTSSIYAKMDRRGLEDAMRKLDDADQDDQAEANHFANRNKYNPQEGNRHDGKRADVLQDKLDEVADEISEGVLEDMQPQSQTNNHNANDHDPDA